MPSGHVHTAINLTTLAAAAVLTKVAEVPLPAQGSVAAFVAAYLIGTFLITPDLDLANQSVSARRNWGPLWWIWVPFGVMSRHRGLNHTYLIGPLLRLAYLALLLLAVHAAVTGLWPDAAQWRPPALSRDVLAGLALGYWVSQALHLAADGIHPLTPLLTRETR